MGAEEFMLFALSFTFSLITFMPSEKLGDLACDLSIVDPDGNSHYLKNSPLFNLDITNPSSFPPITIGRRTAADFEDIDFPGEIWFRFYTADPGIDPTGFGLPGTELGFYEIMYSHNGQGAKAMGVASIFSQAVVWAHVNSETIKEVALICIPMKSDN